MLAGAGALVAALVGVALFLIPRSGPTVPADREPARPLGPAIATATAPAPGPAPAKIASHPFPSSQILVLARGDRLLAAGGDKALPVWALPPADPNLDVPPPTSADLAYIKSAIEDLVAKTPEELEDLSKLELSGQVDDAWLSHLARMTNLESLAINDASRVRGHGLGSLRSLDRLRKLDLARSAVGDAGLGHLTPLTRLETLNLAGTRITSAGIAHLKPLMRPKVLDLQDTPMADFVLQTLIDLPELKSSTSRRRGSTTSGCRSSGASSDSET